ncbi:Mitochondrial substrate carrier family protein L [Zancudomyces culisetae]|uniref:Mitochondrial substrate carrier family protein L n=1 Tax=Zancudomyces culisetae TaxID=1213189 RepID=A0A1R1PQB1_ZANCU|nr:Mitochondrial substrate carrier family protein L [Zancudomyces culisetae]|eukprot:OMH83147.1 Mitochondrial substrate carrier family protein L [Zancudomyces culisetae]
MQGNDKNVKLSSLQHAIAGVGAGWAVALVATPVELTKIRLQIQYAAYGSKEVQQYNGAIDCIRKIVKQNGITGMWYGLPATIMQRSFFFFLWGSYDVYSRWLRSLQRIPEFPYYARQDSAHNKSSGSSVAIHDRMSERAISFIAGGLAANTFWTLVYPVDVAKNKYMASSEKKYKSIFDAAKTIFKAEGIRGFYRGFVPGFIRSFPTNGAAVFVWDTTMRFMVGHGHS